jgi:hypothetical protein
MIAEGLPLAAMPMAADPEGLIGAGRHERAHPGRWCFGRTPMQTVLDSRPKARGEQQNCAAARTARPDSFDLEDARHAKSETVRSRADAMHRAASPRRPDSRGAQTCGMPSGTTVRIREASSAS